MTTNKEYKTPIVPQALFILTAICAMGLISYVMGAALLVVFFGFCILAIPFLFVRSTIRWTGRQWRND